MPVRSAAEKKVIADAKKLANTALNAMNTDADKKNISEAEAKAAMAGVEQVQAQNNGQLTEEAKGVMLVFQGLSRLEDAGFVETPSGVPLKDIKKAMGQAVTGLVDGIKKGPDDNSGPFGLMLAAMLLPKSAGPWVQDQIRRHQDP